jgi:hypothetical protein
MPFYETIAVYTDNLTKSINTKAELLIIKAYGTYIYHWT